MRGAQVALTGLGWLVACGGPAEPLPPTDPAALLATLTDLAGFGEKKVGTPAGAQAGDYVRARMSAIGLADVHFEPFRFPRHDVLGSTLHVTIDGVELDPDLGHDVLGGSAAGAVDAQVVWAGTATDAELAAINVWGKVALVRRVVTFHRSSQYVNLVDRGALAMLYISSADDNLRQVGTTGRDWEPVGAIPAISIGAVDGALIRDAVMAGQDVRAALTVDVDVVPAQGRNVIGRIAGREGTRGEIVIGAHYDTWFTGSSDNGGGVAALLALAGRRVREPRPRYTLVFVAYDGEEVGLYGGYDFLRHHQVIARDPILAVLNFEVPSARDTSFFGLGRSFEPVIDDALRAGGLNFLYPIYVTLGVVPEVFGGVIPTDIQGIYRANLPTVSTAVDTPYYHTTADTPDKVDTEMLAQAVDGFDQAVEQLLAAEPEAFAGDDPDLWKARVTLLDRSTGDPLLIEADITDASGAPQVGAPVTVTLLYDDFFFADRISSMTNAEGVARFGFPPPTVDLGAGYIHVTAGPSYPLVEAVLEADR